MRWFRWVIVLLLALALVACEGGGTTTGGRERCSRRGNEATCEGSWKTLSGTFGHGFEDDDISPGDAVPIEIQVSVESGRLKVSFETPEGETVSAEAAPGQPTTLAGAAEGGFDEVRVQFESLEGKATGISYTVSFLVP